MRDESGTDVIDAAPLRAGALHLNEGKHFGAKALGVIVNNQAEIHLM